MLHCSHPPGDLKTQERYHIAWDTHTHTHILSSHFLSFISHLYINSLGGIFPFAPSPPPIGYSCQLLALPQKTAAPSHLRTRYMPSFLEMARPVKGRAYFNNSAISNFPYSYRVHVILSYIQMNSTRHNLININ